MPACASILKRSCFYAGIVIAKTKGLFCRGGGGGGGTVWGSVIFGDRVRSGKIVRLYQLARQLIRLPTQRNDRLRMSPAAHYPAGLSVRTSGYQTINHSPIIHSAKEQFIHESVPISRILIAYIFTKRQHRSGNTEHAKVTS